MGNFYYNDYDMARDSNIIKDQLRDMNQQLRKNAREAEFSSMSDSNFTSSSVFGIKRLIKAVTVLVVLGFVAMGVIFAVQFLGIG